MVDLLFRALKYSKITDRKIPNMDENKSIKKSHNIALLIYFFFQTESSLLISLNRNDHKKSPAIDGT
jgi:hypothetical protein